MTLESKLHPPQCMQTLRTAELIRIYLSLRLDKGCDLAVHLHVVTFVLHF